MNSVKLSIPKSKIVCGYEIRKLHLGAYLSALEALNDLPRELIAACFLESNGDILKGLADLDGDKLIEMVTRALSVIPSFAVELIARLIEADAEALKNDRRVGLNGLVEMMIAWIEVNDFENFLSAVRLLGQRWTAAKAFPKPTTGFSAFWRKAWSLGSGKASC